MSRQNEREQWNFDRVEAPEGHPQRRIREAENPEAGGVRPLHPSAEPETSGQTAFRRLKNGRNQEEAEDRRKKIGIVEAENMTDGQTRGNQTRGNQTRDDQMRDNQMKDEQMRDDQVRDGQMKDEQMRDGQMKDEQMRDEQMKDNQMENGRMKNDRARDAQMTNGGRNDGNPDDRQRTEERIRETGQVELTDGRRGNHIHLLSIIGEIEGHENLSGNTKTTKYEHILPKLAEIEDSTEVEGVLVLINTVGGDVSCGLALAEMVASLSKPTVSLVIGDSHSIGVPLAVATDYSFIVPTGTMMVHPVRMTGMVIGAVQTYDYFEMIQDRILNFVSGHCAIAYDHLKSLMLNTEMMTKDLGTVLVGGEAVEEGLINEVGGIREALRKLNTMIEENKK